MILDKTEYLDKKDAMIDKDEYIETKVNIERIMKEALGFVEDYMSHVNGTKKLHPNEFSRRYGYSPLEYFHKEMGIMEE